ncbi:hypothetical protein QBC46DRAFT_368991 [Diplogelasinospora grovesii]|uniref:Uncharacterized protein n=1 Tax=Diplogelasinospora grovesii TaxID=303347 RepID=A0AAN6NLD4_9PEZI|nr:hypothetical protein QBC46DRAFT_368991 [Diplogelasinospora grovesii]
MAAQQLRHRHPSRSSVSSTDEGGIELTPFGDPPSLSTTTSSVVVDSPPPYSPPSSSGITSFRATVQLQIETPGKPLLSLPLPPRPDPITVSTATRSPHSSTSVLEPKFVSVRPSRGSGSCYLIPAHPSSPTTGNTEEEEELSTTTYRFGPGRSPIVRLFSPHRHTHSDNDEVEGVEEFELKSVGLLTRAVTFKTQRLGGGGVFEWRYAGRKERRTYQQTTGMEVNNLLVLERVVKIHAARNTNGRDEDVRTPVAYLVRNEEYRSVGSSASSAGNGGRLLVDMSLWGDETRKGETEMGLVMVVTTCLAMLKKEVDRRRAQQIAILAGGGSGGP